ncbi:carbon-nitrogen hydrolase family protein [Celerinatantimonas yamalensis]|uniref:Carbon-nitrogen hydrolase family protein n=1 Tax=Celerinatantimonas yamalensis TaxID=559956 RepID=A0ABW9GBF8_9GAMM
MSHSLHSWRLAALQMCATLDVRQNQCQITDIIAHNPPNPGDLLLLPENFAMLGAGADYRSIAEAPGDGPLQQWLSGLAQQYQITLVAGSLPTRVTGEKRCRSTSIVFDAKGRYITHYHKLHLFDVDVADGVGHYRESERFIAGHTPKWFSHQQSQVGLSICFDLRFSYLYHWLRQQGCEVLLVPAAFTSVTGQAHWLTMLKARAIEQQCYVLAAGQVGHHDSTRQSWGHSCIIDPWGNVIAQLDDQCGICYGKFDHHLLQSLRQRMPLQPNSHMTISWSK